MLVWSVKLIGWSCGDFSICLLSWFSEGHCTTWLLHLLSQFRLCKERLGWEGSHNAFNRRVALGTCTTWPSCWRLVCYLLMQFDCKIMQVVVASLLCFLTYLFERWKSFLLLTCCQISIWNVTWSILNLLALLTRLDLLGRDRLSTDWRLWSLLRQLLLFHMLLFFFGLRSLSQSQTVLCLSWRWLFSSLRLFGLVCASWAQTHLLLNFAWCTRACFFRLRYLPRLAHNRSSCTCCHRLSNT